MYKRARDLLELCLFKQVHLPLKYSTLFSIVETHSHLVVENNSDLIAQIILKSFKLALF